MEKTDFYVAKNRFGMICLFDAKPHKNRRLGQWRIHREGPYHPWHDTGMLRYISEQDLPEGMMLRWSDSHATPIKLSAIQTHNLMITRKLEGSAIRDIDKRLKHVRLQPSKYDDIGGIEYVVFRKSPKFRTSNSRKKTPVKPIAVLTVDPEGIVTELKIKDFHNRSNEDVYRTLAIAVKYDLVIDENTSVVLWKNGKQTGTVNIFPDSVIENK